jgi:hypothetical protein
MQRKPATAIHRDAALPEAPSDANSEFNVSFHRVNERSTPRLSVRTTTQTKITATITRTCGLREIFPRLRTATIAPPTAKTAITKIPIVIDALDILTNTEVMDFTFPDWAH